MAIKNKYFRLLADIGVFGIGNFLVKLIQYFLLPLYTITMSAEAYGTAELLNNLTELLLPVATLALYEGLFRFTIDPTRDKDALLYESMSLTLKVFLVLFAVAGVLQYFISYGYTWYILFVLFSYSIRMLFAGFTRGSGFVKSFSISGIINAGALALFSAIFVAYMQLGVKGYLLAIGCGHAASAVFLAISVRIPQRLYLRKRDKQLLKALLGYSVPLIFSNVAWWATSMSSRYIILFSYGAAIAGLYTAANKLPAVISMVSQVFQQAWQLNSARESHSEAREEFYNNVLRYYVAVILLFSSAMVCAMPILAKMTLHNEFYAARYYIPLMVLCVGIHCISAYFGSLLLALERSRQAMQGMLLGAVVNVVLALALVRPFGVWGALIASVVCYLVILAHRTYSVGKHMKIDKNLPLNFPLFFILCVQTGLMSIGSKSCVTISIILLALMILLSAFSFRRDIKLLLVACRSCKK